MWTEYFKHYLKEFHASVVGGEWEGIVFGYGKTILVKEQN
jgi:hypothetical protein